MYSFLKSIQILFYPIPESICLFQHMAYIMSNKTCLAYIIILLITWIIFMSGCVEDQYEVYIPGERSWKSTYIVHVCRNKLQQLLPTLIVCKYFSALVDLKSNGRNLLSSLFLSNLIEVCLNCIPLCRTDFIP